MSLGWRLIISYIIIILVTLFFSFLTLLVIARPVQNRIVTTRLSTQSRLVGRQVNNLYRQGVPSDRELQQISNRLARLNSHTILVDSQGVVLADSQDLWTGQQLEIPAVDSGRFTTPENQTYYYASTPVGPPGHPAGYVVAVSRGSALANLITELGGGFILAGIVALLVSLVLGIFIARSIAQPLKQVARATSAVAAGNYNHRLPEKGPPEIKRVAASFNVMAGQVEAGQQAMRDFVSNVSHELKTPLTSIQGFSQAIMEDATQDEAARRRAAGIIHQEAGRMSRMAEDLLDLARIDSGQVAMNKTPLDMVQILKSTVERLLPQAVKKDVKLVTDWDKLPQITGDGDRLAQVFTNFLDNAVKHTPSGGRVTIAAAVAKSLPHRRPMKAGLVNHDATAAVSTRGDFVEISIRDTGPGIPQEDLNRIFERFYQVDKSRKRGQGSGLGLAITKEIIDAHGGYVRAESLEGVGTKFVVLLPVTGAGTPTLISSRQ